jgi:hypothetical protein
MKSKIWENGSIRLYFSSFHHMSWMIYCYMLYCRKICWIFEGARFTTLHFILIHPCMPDRLVTRIHHWLRYTENWKEITKIASSHQFHKSCRKYKFATRANTDLWIYQRWDQVPRSQHPLSTSHKINVSKHSKILENAQKLFSTRCSFYFSLWAETGILGSRRVWVSWFCPTAHESLGRATLYSLLKYGENLEY